MSQAPHSLCFWLGQSLGAITYLQTSENSISGVSWFHSIYQWAEYTALCRHIRQFIAGCWKQIKNHQLGGKLAQNPTQMSDEIFTQPGDKPRKTVCPLCVSECAGTHRAADHLSTSKIYSAASGKGQPNDLIACQHLHRETRTGTSSFFIFFALNRNSQSKSLEPGNQTVRFLLTWVHSSWIWAW